MAHKKISRDELIERAVILINKLPTIVDDDFYESEDWKNVRDSYKKENPLCELCLNEGRETKTRDIHHITPLRRGGEPFSQENLIALCKSCHKSMHGTIGGEISIESMLFDEEEKCFTTQLKGIDESIIKQSKTGEELIIIREKRDDNQFYMGVANKSGHLIGKIPDSITSRYSLAYDFDHGAGISVNIKEITDDNKKIKCTIEITKCKVDWDKVDRLNLEERDSQSMVRKAYTLDKTDPEKAIKLFREVILRIKEIDKNYGEYARNIRYPIDRLTFILEKKHRYKECLEEIEAYENKIDRIGLTISNYENLIKRKARIMKLI